MTHVYKSKKCKCDSCSKETDLFVIEVKKESKLKKIFLCKDCLKMLKSQLKTMEEYYGL